MTNNPTKYEHTPSYGCRGVAYRVSWTDGDHYYAPPARIDRRLQVIERAHLAFG